MKIHLLILLFCLMASSAWGSALEGRCQIEFSGSSTLHDFSGQAACQPFILFVTGNADAGLEFTDTVIFVSVASMDTDNSKRDVKMREMFESEKYPQIKASPVALSSQMIERFVAGRSGKNGTLEFNLKIRDIELPQTAQVSNLLEDDKQLSFDLAFDLSLKSYQLKAPSVLGLIRVGDQVHLKIPVQLNKDKLGLKFLPL